MGATDCSKLQICGSQWQREHFDGVCSVTFIRGAFFCSCIIIDQLFLKRITIVTTQKKLIFYNNYSLCKCDFVLWRKEDVAWLIRHTDCSDFVTCWFLGSRSYSGSTIFGLQREIGCPAVSYRPSSFSGSRGRWGRQPRVRGTALEAHT